MLVKTYKNYRCTNCYYLVKVLVSIVDEALRITGQYNHTNITTRCPKCDSLMIYPIKE